METRTISARVLRLLSSSYRTYEEWKRRYSVLAKIYELSSYRTYEEWKHELYERYKTNQECSYRTYEEWKPYIYRLPYLLSFWFLPYLWGMETNGMQHKIARIFTEVLTVPMRNGNNPYSGNLKRSTHSSYRTYEEWKRFLQKVVHLTPKCSYRTYEEWKPSGLRNFRRGVLFVLTVPMRNGNSSKYLFENTLYTVLTVPMRNGNSNLWYPKISSLSVLTVPMRNGNSKLSKIENHWFSCSYRTYEEWKHIRSL